MYLTKEQSEMFIEFYRGLYGQIHHMPTISYKDYAEHVRLWKAFVRRILGSQYDKTYKIRPYGPESYGEKVFSSLFMQYFPSVIKEDGEPADFDLLNKIDREGRL